MSQTTNELRALIEAARRVVDRDPLEMGFAEDVDALEAALDAFTARHEQAQGGMALDAARFRDLCELVRVGELALCVVADDPEDHEYLDGLDDIPPLLDRMADSAASWRRARERVAATRPTADARQETQG